MSKEAYSHYLLEVKQEYTKQLSNLLVPVIYEGLNSIYREAKKNNKDAPMKMFQILLSRIPNWNQNIINGEYQRIIQKTQCDWINDLITAVFISHAKILSSIKTKKKSKTLNLKIPNGDYFIHKAYIECARQFWKNPYLFYDDVNTIEYQRNMREVELIIEQAVNETVRKLLPVKNILQQYIAIDEESSSSSSSESSSSEEEEEEKPKKKKSSKKKEEEKAKYDEEYITSNIPEKDKKKLEKSVKREVSKARKEESTNEAEDNYSTVSVSHDIKSKPKTKKTPEIVEEKSMKPLEEEHSLKDEIPPPILSVEILPNLSVEGGSRDPSKLKEEPEMYKSLDISNSRDILLSHDGDVLEYPPKVSDTVLEKSMDNEFDLSLDQEIEKSVNNTEKRTDIDHNDDLSMNTRLDRSFIPSIHDNARSAKTHSSVKNIKISIDDIPKLASVEEPPREIKNIVINTSNMADNESIDDNMDKKPVITKSSNIAKKRDIKKNYSFF